MAIRRMNWGLGRSAFGMGARNRSSYLSGQGDPKDRRVSADFSVGGLTFRLEKNVIPSGKQYGVHELIAPNDVNDCRENIALILLDGAIPMSETRTALPFDPAA